MLSEIAIRDFETFKRLLVRRRDRSKKKKIRNKKAHPAFTGGFLMLYNEKNKPPMQTADYLQQIEELTKAVETETVTGCR